MYPIKNYSQLSQPMKSLESQALPIKQEQKLNVVMLMVDSLSRASTQRYMNKTYALIENDPDSVIMKVNKIRIL